MPEPIELTHLSGEDITFFPADFTFTVAGPHYLLARGRHITADVSIHRARHSALRTSVREPEPSRTEERISLIFLLDGEVTFVGSGQQLRAGQATCIPGRITSVRALTPVDVVHVIVRTAMLAEHGVLPATIRFESALRSHLVAPMQAFFMALLNEPEPAGTEELTASSILNVIAVLLLEDFRLAGVDPTCTTVPSRMDRARRIIETSAGDAGLTPARVAEGVGVSVRTLQRLFTQEGLAVADEIRRRRVLIALEALQDPTRGPMPVGDAARLARFRSTRQFREAFKRETGSTPRGVRSASAGAAMS